MFGRGRLHVVLPNESRTGLRTAAAWMLERNHRCHRPPWPAPNQGDILKTLPHFAHVEAKPVDTSTTYIIHILDWHFVHKDALNADVREQGIAADLDAKLIEAREDAIVKNVLARGPVSLLVLGGAHDLSNNVPKDCQYIRVSTKAFEAMLRE